MHAAIELCPLGFLCLLPNLAPAEPEQAKAKAGMCGIDGVGMSV